MDTVAQILMNNNDLQPKVLEYRIKTCDNCGEPVEKIINLLGKERIVPIMCSCKKEKYES